MPQGKIETLHVVHITDTHLFAEADGQLYGVTTRETFKAVVEQLTKGPQVDLVLMTGDMAQDGSALAYEAFREEIRRLGCPVYCLPGNHDDPTLMKELFNTGDVLRLSNICHNGWQFILLDSTVPGEVGGRLGDEQIAYLNACLFNHPDCYGIVCLHHQPFAVGSAWLDQVGLAQPEAFREIVARFPQVKAVLWGHVHQSWDDDRDDVKYLATPATAAQFKPGSVGFALDTKPPAWRRLTLYPDGRLESSLEWLGQG